MAKKPTAGKDPRAELAKVQRQRLALDQLFELLVEHDGKRVYPPKLEEGVTIEHDTGFISAIDIRIGEELYKKKRSVRASLDKLLATRAARLVRKVHIDVYDKKPAGPGKDVLAALALLVARAPALRSLALWIRAEAGPVDLDLAAPLAKLRVEELSLVTSVATLKSVVAGTWPHVRRLDLDGRAIERIVPADLKRLFDGKAFPALEQLSIDLPEVMLAALFKSPLVAKLRVLDLSGSRLDNDLAKQVVKNQAKLKHLDKLVIRADEYLTAKHHRELRNVCKDVTGLLTDHEITWLEGELKRLAAESAANWRYEEIEE